MDKQQLARFCKRRYQTLEIVGCGSVTIQSFSELERATILDSSEGSVARQHSLMIVYSLVDPAKNHLRIFSDDDVEDVCKMDAAISSQLVDAISSHCMDTVTYEDSAKN